MRETKKSRGFAYPQNGKTRKKISDKQKAWRWRKEINRALNHQSSKVKCEDVIRKHRERKFTLSRKEQRALEKDAARISGIIPELVASISHCINWPP